MEGEEGISKQFDILNTDDFKVKRVPTVRHQSMLQVKD